MITTINNHTVIDFDDDIDEDELKIMREDLIFTCMRMAEEGIENAKVESLLRLITYMTDKEHSN